MNAPSLRFPILFATIALLAASPRSLCAPAAAPAAHDPATIQRQIDALLKHRLKPEPLPLDLPNPFTVVSGGIRDTPTPGGASKPAAKGDDTGATAALSPVEVASASSAEILARLALRLKINGIVRINDQFQLVINDSPRKEGDFITADWNGTAVQLRIIRIVPGQLTLRYGDAEMMLKFQ